MRITFILPSYSPRPSGGYRVVYHYADFLAMRGHAVTIIFPRANKALRHRPVWQQYLKGVFAETRLALTREPVVNWHALHPSIECKMTSFMDERDIPEADIVVATAWSTAQSVARLSPSKGAKFYLVQHHEIWEGRVEEVNDTWLLPLNKIVISKWLFDLNTEFRASGNIRLIPNGIDLDHFKIIEPPSQRKLSILTLYHKSSYKGIPAALAVLKMYHDRFPEIPISMFGACPRGHEIPEWITYHQNPDQETLVRDIYNQNRIYLATSIAEGWALPPAEAMACGCAFVGTDIGGFRDYSLNEVTALLSAPGDTQGIFSNLTRLTEDQSLLNRIQQAGTENIGQFTWEAAGTAMELYFNQSLHKLAERQNHRNI